MPKNKAKKLIIKKIEITQEQIDQLHADGTLFEYLDMCHDEAMGKRVFTKYCPATAWQICERISLGDSLRNIEKEDWSPSRMTISRWLAKHEDFRERYNTARSIWAEMEFERTIDIADSVIPYDNACVNKARLQVDTRKWAVGKLLPKKYGKEGQGVEPQTLPEVLKQLPDDLRAAVLELNQVKLHLASTSSPLQLHAVTSTHVSKLD